MPSLAIQSSGILYLFVCLLACLLPFAANKIELYPTELSVAHSRVEIAQRCSAQARACQDSARVVYATLRTVALHNELCSQASVLAKVALLWCVASQSVAVAVWYAASVVVVFVLVSQGPRTASATVAWIKSL